jgi:hypothetical protein
MDAVKAALMSGLVACVRYDVYLELCEGASNRWQIRSADGSGGLNHHLSIVVCHLAEGLAAPGVEGSRNFHLDAVGDDAGDVDFGGGGHVDRIG